MAYRISASAMLNVTLVAAVGVPQAHADNFAGVVYNATDDELLITMIYRGTNPDHTFSFEWGPCRRRQGRQHEIGVSVRDAQWRDNALRDFSKIVHLSLTKLSCRPAKLTLRTAPHFFYSLDIPATNVARR